MRYRFGVFEANIDSRELRKSGTRVRIQEKPFVVLTALAERPGQVVTREELRTRLWPRETFVDFDNNLNTALRRLRDVLGDSAETPRFVETVPRIGYRFIADVEQIDVAAPKNRSQFTPTVALMAGAAVASLVAALILALSLSPRSPKRNMLVVLPFENLDGDTELEYFADGLTEEVLTELSRADPEALGVIGKSSAMKLKKSGEDIETIGRMLGVDYVLEGGVRRSGDHLRITTRLLRVADRSQVWAERYDRSWTDALSLQGEVMRDIAKALGPTLLPAAPAPRRVVNHEAQEAFLKGLYRENKGAREDLETARDYYDDAIAIDAGHSRAHAAKARVLLGLLFRGAMERDAGIARIKVHVSRALELDPELGEAELALANVLFYFDWDFPAAGNAYRRALALSPGSDQVHYWATGYFSAIGEHEEAIRSIEEAVALNPAEMGVLADRGLYYLAAGRYDEAIEDCRRIIELEGELRFALDCLLRSHVAKRNYREAAEVVASLLENDGASADTIDELSALPPEKSVERFRRWELERLKQRENVPPLELARQYALVSEADFAIAELEKAVASRSASLVYLANDSRFAALRCDARFESVVRRIAGEALASARGCS